MVRASVDACAWQTACAGTLIRDRLGRAMSDDRWRLPDEPCLRGADSVAALAAVRFRAGVNAACWPRRLTGDFAQVVAALEARLASDGDGVVQIDEVALAALALDDRGAAAVQTVHDDLRALEALGLQPELSLVRAYRRADPGAVIGTDVCSWHVDRAPHELDTWLCTYHGAPSLGLPPDHARALVDDPACRARLRAEFGGDEGDAFDDFLREHSYDLHYAPIAGARAWSFGVGNLWRIATAWPGSPAPPCVHRAPDDVPGQRRLLLIC